MEEYVKRSAEMAREEGVNTHCHNDSWLFRDLVRNIDVHVDFGGIRAEVIDFLQLRGERHLRS